MSATTEVFTAQIAAWREEARALIDQELDHPLQLEWLGGRISALTDALALLNGEADDDAHRRMRGPASAPSPDRLRHP